MTATIIRGRFPTQLRAVEPETPDPVAIAERKFADAHAAWWQSPCTASLLHRLWAQANVIELRDRKPYRQARAEAAADAEQERAAAVLMGVYRGDPGSPIDDLSEEWKRERWNAQTDGGAA